MSGFIDPSLIGELSATVLGVTQAVKNRPRLRKVDGEAIAIAVGVLTGLLWFLTQGQIVHSLSWHGIDWQETFVAAVNGVLGGITASTGFNLQKVIPLPNLLPTRTEKDATLAAEETAAASAEEGKPL